MASRTDRLTPLVDWDKATRAALAARRAATRVAFVADRIDAPAVRIAAPIARPMITIGATTTMSAAMAIGEPRGLRAGAPWDRRSWQPRRDHGQPIVDRSRRAARFGPGRRSAPPKERCSREPVDAGCQRPGGCGGQAGARAEHRHHASGAACSRRRQHARAPPSGPPAGASPRRRLGAASRAGARTRQRAREPVERSGGQWHATRPWTAPVPDGTERLPREAKNVGHGVPSRARDDRDP